MSLSPRLRAPRDDDRGVTLILVALAMVAVLAVAAMAIDLGAKRADRRGDQTVADLASLSAGSFLAGNGSATVISNAALACQAAVESAKTNVSGFSPTQNIVSTCAVFPANTKTMCNETTTPQSVVFSDSSHTLTIRYPIPTSELADSRFSGGGENDGTNRCERMRVTFSHVSDAGFARLLGVDNQTTSASSVMRATTSQLGQGVAALLLLERVSCGSLQNSGQAQVVVKAPSATNPGVVQADSAGQMPPCTTNTNSGGYVIYGPQLPSNGPPSIVAETSGNGTPGIIGIFALSLTPQGRGGAVFPNGLSVAPVRSTISSRQPVDDKYNGTSSQISTFHALAYTRTGWTAATATASGYAIVTQCNGSGIAAATLIAQKVFVDCATFEPDVNIFPNATDFVVRGNVNIKVNKVLSLPAVRNFLIRGNGTSALAVSGNLLTNTGEAALPASPYFTNGVKCSARKSVAYGGTTANWTRIGTLNGEISITGQARLCQTFVYMGRNTASYTRQSVTAAAVAPELYPALAKCQAVLPCPKDGVDTSWPFSVSGGGAATDWSAPNQLNVQPQDSDFATNPFEDLALWSETSSINVAMKGQAGNLTEGVFFLPNASALFQGQGAQPILLNAQFLIRKLNMSGQGTLTLSPNPADAVVTPIPGAVALIR